MYAVDIFTSDVYKKYYLIASSPYLNGILMNTDKMSTIILKVTFIIIPGFYTLFIKISGF